jgi:hypothetical protein
MYCEGAKRKRNSILGLFEECANRISVSDPGIHEEEESRGKLRRFRLNRFRKIRLVNPSLDQEGKMGPSLPFFLSFLRGKDDTCKVHEK